MLRFLLSGFLLVAAAGFCRAAAPELSVIQILVFSQQPAWDAPWRFDGLQRSTGSGFVIKGKRIMTNAHVVSWARQILVRRYQDPRPYVAQVEFISHECDLAVLTVEDPSFFERLEPLDFGELPKVRSSVVTYGYPAGGEEISYTRGVVSRIERQVYAHTSLRQFLAVQTDAAINPGNSGGPVIQDDRVVGVAFQGLQGLENSGFFIPPPVVRHFLDDIADGRLDGVPRVGIQVASMLSPAHRSWLKLPENDLGVRIDRVLPFCSEKTLKEDDVLFRIGSFPVASDGTILFEGNRVAAGVAFQLAQAGQTIPVTVWRDGAETNLSLPVRTCNADDNLGFQYDTLPRYFIHGGLVFTPLSLNYLRAVGVDPADPSRRELVYELRYRNIEDPQNTRPEPIVLAAVLPHEVNANWTASGRALVDRINGVRIEKLEDVIRAFTKHEGAYHSIEFVPNNALESISREAAAKANDDILKNYGISSDRRL